ncbi:MAG: glycosyltransferase family 1 protein [Gammaproteobacteria bacterium]|nr:glycosyltransferase family 1 protein [Gammaproteobacteria bacterium]
MQDRTLKILYVTRKWFKDWSNKSIVKSTSAWLKRKEFTGQGGFFEASLFSSCNVDTMPIERVVKKTDFINSSYDIVIVNSKFHKRAAHVNNFKWIDSLKIPAVLFYGGAKAHKLHSDEILDYFDLVYKRELLQDLSRYNNSDNNRQKLRTTMLSCPIVRTQKTQPIQLGEIPVPKKLSDSYEYDIFFSGDTRTNKIRKEIVERLSRESFVFYGGLYNNKISDENYTQKRFGLDEYKSTIRNSKISLALEGWGQFTYRHLEVWCLGGFSLSTPSIRDIQLPFANPQEGIHYVAFDGLDDLVSKVSYYLEHDEEREKIANAGRSLFEKIYDPIAHGKEIETELRLLI